MTQLLGVFRPTMHLLFLVWRTCPYYASAQRLMPMLRRLCMCIINKCTTYLALSATMFDAPEQTIEKLKVAIELCQSTKSVYVSYRQRASDEPLPLRIKEVIGDLESGRREGTASVWLELEMRFAQPLDLFVERCQEVLFMLRIHIQFGLLKSVHLGGTQGRGHTRLVQQMCTELNSLTVQLKAVSAQLLDVSEDHSLDDLLYSQRVVIRNIERRLTRVISDAMASAGTWREQLGVLMLFEPVLARKDVQFALQQPRVAVLEAVIEEVLAVEAECLGQSSEPPIFDNMPTYAGSLYWSESVRQRFYEPLQRVRRILKAEIEGTDVGKMLVAVWTRILEMLENFDQGLISDFEQVALRVRRKAVPLPCLRAASRIERLSCAVLCCAVLCCSYAGARSRGVLGALAEAHPGSADGRRGDDRRQLRPDDRGGHP